MPTDSELMRRVQHLEHENHRLKQFGITALVLIAGVLAMGQARPARTIEAEVFLLKDVDGNVKAKLDVKDGLTKLTFLDRAGHERVALTSAEDSAALEMKDEKGRLGATMEAGSIQRWNVVNHSGWRALDRPYGGAVCRHAGVRG